MTSEGSSVWYIDHRIRSVHGDHWYKLSHEHYDALLHNVESLLAFRYGMYCGIIPISGQIAFGLT
ncbi:MAG: hypothetical protein FD169_2484 [Bacillota bacterium]|nr:MAG: hypothetical protein FD169_2484 [Bacillota bacterium]